MKDVSRSTQKTQGKEEILQLEDGLLYCKGLFWIPENAQKVILHTKYNSRVAGYFGQDKTIELIRRNF
jgi:hypothetical protein